MWIDFSGLIVFKNSFNKLTGKTSDFNLTLNFDWYPSAIGSYPEFDFGIFASGSRGQRLAA